MSNARLFVKKSTRRRYSGGSMPNGTHSASHAAPASQTGHTGRWSDGGLTPAEAAIAPDEFVERRHLAARQDVGAARRRRRFAAQPEPLDEVVDVREVVEDLAGPERHEPPPRDAPEQLEQPAVAGAVDPARPGDDQFHARSRAAVASRGARLRASSADNRRRAAAARPRRPADVRRRRGRRRCCSAPRGARPPPRRRRQARRPPSR